MSHDHEKFRFNPKSRSFLREPYPSYSLMRQEYPYYRIGNTLILTRYEDVYVALRDRSLVTSGIPLSLISEFARNQIQLSCNHGNIINNILLFQDGDTHYHHRKSVMKLLSRDSLNKLDFIIQSEVNALITEIGDARNIDFIRKVGQPLWFRVFSKWLQLNPDDAAVLSQQGENIRLLLDPSAITKEGLHHLVQALDNLSVMFQKNYFENKKRNDVSLFLSSVGTGETSYNAMDFTIDAITAFIGGGETTAALIGSAVFLLTRFPDVQTTLRSQPALIHNAIQETMRFESPLQMTRRRVVTPMDFRGIELKIDDNVLLCLGAANRDDAIFRLPATFDIERKNSNKQLGFGGGMHQCLGQLLAQRQAEIVCSSLLNNFRSIMASEDCQPVWQESSLILRSLSCLPVTLC
jgi:cytochrome P450